jgi:SWI/SNF-related matrix-associated actin-dependent regulator 1 of chromatin subfamily A
VQNDVGELLALLSFLMPSVFSRHKCELLIEAFGWHRNASAEAAGKSGGLSLTQLRTMLAPFVLRRLKREVLNQLVEKVNHIEKVAMTALQKKVYDSIILGYSQRKALHRAQIQAQREIDQLIEVKKAAGKKQASKKSKDTEVANLEDSAAVVVDMTLVDDDAVGMSADDIQEVVQGLSASEAKHLFTALRKAANHPLLLRVKYQDNEALDYISQVALVMGHFGNQCDFKRVRAEVDKFSDFDLHQLCLTYADSLGQYTLPGEVLYESPKCLILKELLPRLIVSFAQW